MVTGDIAEAARRGEYEQARIFFETLLGELGLPRRCAVFVSGNHDVSWNATKTVVNEQDDDERQVAVAALSSCERESHLAQGGYLSEAQAKALLARWRAGAAHSWLDIIAVHHNPVATVPSCNARPGGRRDPDRRYTTSRLRAARHFAAACRETLKRTHERWELGGLGAVQSGGARRPVEATIDEDAASAGRRRKGRGSAGMVTRSASLT